MIKIAFFLVLLVAVLFAVSLPVKADPVFCDSIFWQRPTTYATGDALPADKPDGYIAYFSTDPQPITANAAKVVDVTGPNSTQTPIPAEFPDGPYYVRMTAYIDDQEHGRLESDWSNTVFFSKVVGKCNAPGTPGSGTGLKLSFPGQ